MPNTIAVQSGFNLVRPNPRFILPNGMPINQFASNVATLGQASSFIPPYMLGYNPYPQVANYGPVIGPTIAPSPYGLSTLPSGAGNPYLGTGYGAGLATDPSAAYSLSTTGSPAGYSPYGYPMYGGYGSGGYGSGYGTPSSQDIYAYSGYLRGAADLTAASGKYWKDIQQARISREQSRQMALETQRRRIMDEAAYERMKPTALDLYNRAQAASLDWARKDPPATFIWSGQALNDLLRSVGNSGDKLNRGPNIPLEDDTLKSINLTDGSSRGNIGLLKDGGKVTWPLPLHDSQYDEARKQLSKNLIWAVQQLKDKDPIDRATLRDIQRDYRKLNDLLAAGVSDMSPSQYIESRRFLNQLGESIRALEDPKAANYFSSWTPKGKNVAELVSHMLKEGLKFAPATGGDEAAYRSLYQALKAYEAGLQVAQRGS